MTFVPVSQKMTGSYHNYLPNFVNVQVVAFWNNFDMGVAFLKQFCLSESSQNHLKVQLSEAQEAEIGFLRIW